MWCVLNACAVSAMIDVSVRSPVLTKPSYVSRCQMSEPTFGQHAPCTSMHADMHHLGTVGSITNDVVTSLVVNMRTLHLPIHWDNPSILNRR